MKSLRSLMAWCVIAIGFAGPAAAQPTGDAVEGAPPRRLALVIGNGAYANASQLPGAAIDAGKMSDILKSLDFTVTIATDVSSRSDFVFNYLRPFIATIKEGDVALFYFSGHGFTYGGENYITPLDFDLEIDSNDILGTFISTTGIEMQMTDRKAGLVLMILDACRNIPNFNIKTRNQEDSGVAKGLAEPRGRVASTVYWFSSGLGATSIGSSERKLSVYTEVLADNMVIQARDLDDILREVRVAVMFRTGRGQVPYTSGSSSAQFFFKPTPAILDEQKRLWQAARDEGTRFAITRFLEIYGTGPYGAAARNWLVTNPTAPDTRPSAVSPLTAEVAWTTSAGRNVALPRVGGRVVARATSPLRPIDAAALPAPGANAGTTETTIREEAAAIDAARTSQPAIASARTLDRLGGGVVVGSVEARASPKVTAPIVLTLPPGAAVTIDGLTIDGAEGTWLRARTGKDDTSFFIEQKGAPAAPIEVGKAKREVRLLPNPSGVKSIVDETPLVAALDQLRSAGTTVTWVSIATPKAKEPGGEAVFGLQAVYVKSILARLGISRDVVTTSEGASDGDIRVRIFGKGGAE